METGNWFASAFVEIVGMVLPFGLRALYRIIKKGTCGNNLGDFFKLL